MGYTVRDLVEEHGKALQVEVCVGGEALDKSILVAEAQRVGLGLAGYLGGHNKKRIMVFSPSEAAFMKDLDEEKRAGLLGDMCFEETPAIVIAQGCGLPCKVAQEVCEKAKMPLLCSTLEANTFIATLYGILTARFAPTINRHGTLVEVFGVGVLIEGDSGVGKSEAALGLLSRGHRLIADDIVKVFKEEDSLRGKGDPLTRHLMEIRGIGIIDVAQLYGAVCVREYKRIDLVVHLEAWDDSHHYDRVGLDVVHCDILDVSVPYHVVPVKPGRDVVLILETLALNHRLKAMGRCPAKTFSDRLSKAITERSECID